MEDSLADNEIDGGGDKARRKSSRNSIVFKAIPEISRYVESSEDDSSADVSLALAGLDDDAERKPEPRRSIHTSVAPSGHRRDLSEGTQSTIPPTVISAVKRFAKQLSSLGFHSTSEEISPSNINNVRVSSSAHLRDGHRLNSSRTNDANRRSSGLSARTISSVVSDGGSPPTEKYCLSDGKINALRYLINHPVWTFSAGFFVFVMLFGAPVQDLFLPASADVAVDVVFTFAFITLLVDILIRCIVDKAYFAWDRVGTFLTPQKTCKWFNTHAGSFMFWCDIIGTLTFIYDLSYINTLRTRPMTVDLILEDGFPVRKLRLSFTNVPSPCL